MHELTESKLLIILVYHPFISSTSSGVIVIEAELRKALRRSGSIFSLLDVPEILNDGKHLN